MDIHKMESQRYQVIPLAIDSANAANNVVSDSETLDRAYSRITGIAVVITDAGGIAAGQFLIGAKTTRQVWVDPIPAQLWDPDGAPLDMKFLSTNIPYGSGDEFFISAANLIALNTDAQMYMVVRLVEDYTQLPRK